jgi:hypothetical protein
MLPPHLPKPSCNIATHQKWLGIKIVIFGSLFGLIAGLTGAFIVIGWIWPGYGGGDTWVVSQNRNQNSSAKLDEVISRDSSDRVFTIYKTVSKLNELEYLAAENKLGEAVVISSDGWLALAVDGKDASLGLLKARALGSDGTVFAVQKNIFDPYTKILYIKINPVNQKISGAPATQFRVAGFEESIAPFDEIFVRANNEWRQVSVGYKTINAGTRLDSAPGYSYLVSGEFSAGTVAINSRGRVVGLIDPNGRLFPSIFVTRIMPSILGEQKIVYPTFGVSGWLSAEEPAVVASTTVAGFVVDNVWDRKSKLKRGDVIMEINGQIVRDETLWYNISGKQAVLIVWRGKAAIELTVDIFEAKADSL